MRVRINEEIFERPHGKKLLKLIKAGCKLSIISEVGGFYSISKSASFLKNSDLYEIWKEASRKRKRNKTADRLVYSGLTLQQIAELSGWPDRRFVDEYYRKTGQLETWREYQPGFLNHVSSCIQSVEDNLRNTLAEILQLAQANAYRGASLAQRTTFEYFQLCPRSRINWTALETTLERYFSARDEGKRYSFKTLVYGLEINIRTVYRVIRELNLSPLTEPHRQYLPEEKEAAKRAFCLNMSIRDISYFLPTLPYNYLLFLWSKIGNRPKIDTSFLGEIRNYRTASKLYEMYDNGQVEQITDQLTRTKMKEALEKRYFLEPIIMHALRIIYLNPKINKPYLITP